MGPNLTYAAGAQGAYRVEVTLPIPGFFGVEDRKTWIYSNAIYLRRAPPPGGKPRR